MDFSLEQELQEIVDALKNNNYSIDSWGYTTTNLTEKEHGKEDNYTEPRSIDVSRSYNGRIAKAKIMIIPKHERKPNNAFFKKIDTEDKRLKRDIISIPEIFASVL